MYTTQTTQPATHTRSTLLPLVRFKDSSSNTHYECCDHMLPRVLRRDSQWDVHNQWVARNNTMESPAVHIAGVLLKDT